jgi:uncharacterized membrane protein (Fun14 family)
VGVVFLGLQALQHAGFIDSHWGKAQDKLVSALDQNDDGKLDKEDLIKAKNSLLPIVTKGLPGAGGFAAGFLVAWRWA